MAAANQNNQQQNLPSRNCTECTKKPPQVQCLHCSQLVCLGCAQKHVNLVAEESDGAMHLLNEKLYILDRIAASTQNKIATVCDKIVKMVDAERDRSFTLLAQMIDEEKQQLRNKNKQLNELPLNEIPMFIQKLKSNVQYLTDESDGFFNIGIIAPRIILRRKNDQNGMQFGEEQQKVWCHNEEDEEEDGEEYDQEGGEEYDQDDDEEDCDTTTAHRYLRWNTYAHDMSAHDLNAHDGWAQHKLFHSILI